MEDQAPRPHTSVDALVQPLLATALATIANAVVVTDAAGTILWVNRAFTRMSGYGPDEAVGRTPRLLKSGLQDAAFYRRLWSTVRAGTTWHGEVVNRHRDGHLYTVAQSITPLLDAAGDPAHFVAVHEDVTALRTSQARLRALYEQSLDPIVFFDDDGRCLDANPATAVLTGYPLDVLRSMRLADLLSEAQWTSRASTLEADGHARGTASVTLGDGSTAQVEYQAVRTVLPGVHLAVCRDVTEQRRVEAAHHFQAQLLDAAGEAVIATDLDGIVRYANPAAGRLFGWDAQAAVGRDVRDLTVTDATAEQAEEIMARVGAGETWTGEFPVRRADGTTFPALVTDAPYVDAAGDLAGIIGMSTDISTLKAAQEAVARRAAQQTATTVFGRYALVATDLAAMGAEAERLVVDVLGAHHGQVEVRWTGRWLPERTPDVPADAVQIPIGGDGVILLKGGIHGPDTEERDFLGGIANLLHAAARQHAARTQLTHQANHDALTGLPNRTLFLSRIDQARAALTSNDGRFAVLLCDLDGFKDVNDALGHDTGDRVLRMVAERFAQVVRPTDTVARFGGDEFAVLCPQVDGEQEARMVAERIQLSLAAPFPLDDAAPTVTASIGLVLGDAASDGLGLLQDADAAMYAAKDAGRSRVAQFDPAFHHQARERLEITIDLRAAMDSGNGIELRYQPTVELETGGIIGVEALVRLRRPDGVLVSPDQFIPVAEGTGLIGPLGLLVLAQACRAARPWVAARPEGFTLAVNVSFRQLGDAGFACAVLEVLAEARVPASALLLEVTESGLMSGPEVLATMGALREQGIRFAIDDFGTGYSSLSYLRNLPVDVLKIDRSFVSGITENLQDRSLVGAAIHLAHSFGLEVIAEGVETDQQRLELLGLGGDHGQGYLWSPPVEADAITALLER